MRKKIAAALTGAVLVLALAGCGDDGNKELDAWAKSVCDSVKPQLAKIEKANSDLAKAASSDGKPAAVKATDSAAFGQVSTAYTDLAAAISKAGPPPVDDGQKLGKAAVTELNGIAKAYADLKKRVDDLDTKEQADFAEGLQGVGTDLAKLASRSDQALQDLQSGDVGKAMAGLPGCRRAGSDTSAGSGAASSSPAS